MSEGTPSEALLKLNFLSLPYFVCLLLSAGFVVGIYFLFRKRSARTKKAVLLVLMLLNIEQHLLKSFVWPHLYGQGFTYQNTCYNVCASLILLSPFIFFFGKGALRDALVYVGTAGTLLAVVVPFWFSGQDVFSWEVLRFYVCHVLLITTSILPALWGLTELSYRRFAFVPLFFFGLLILILMNAVICVSLGLVGKGTGSLFETLYSLNPCWVMHPAPPKGFEWVTPVLEAFTPPVFLGAGTRPYTPLLWYAIPMYLLLALLSLLIGILVDHRRFAADLRKLFRKKKTQVK